MNGLLLAAWLTLGWMPRGGVVEYKPPDIAEVSRSGLVELGVEVSWGPVFAGGSMMVPVWYSGTPENLFAFWPIQLASTTDVGLAFDNVRIGWKHTCAHPVLPGMPVAWWEGELVPAFDSAYDLVYVTLSVGKRKGK